MKRMRLSDMVTFSLGDNPSRMKVAESDIYTQEDLVKDLSGENATMESSVCIINLMRSNAAPLSKQTATKKITSNFLHGKLNSDYLDPWYFCYQFNEGAEIQQQISRYSQGTVLSVKRLNMQMIGDMQIPVPDMEKQKAIGAIYRLSVKQHALLCKQAEDLKAMTLATIRKIEED